MPSSSEEELTSNLQIINDQQVVGNFNNLPSACIPQISTIKVCWFWGCDYGRV